MVTPRGAYSSPTPFRRLVIDLMHFSAQVPGATIERLMPLEPLITARKFARNPPTWSAIFTKAFAMVAREIPDLRTTYLNFPFGRYYLHPHSIATINVHREIEGESAILFAAIPSPDKLPLGEIDAQLKGYQENPVAAIPSFQQALKLTGIPWPFRRMVWWGALNLSGPFRCRNFGTFGISSLGGQGAGITHLAPMQTSQLHYGMFTPEGILPMRLSFDHRVLDGVSAANALARLEATLLENLVAECKALPGNTWSQGNSPPEFSYFDMSRTPDRAFPHSFKAFLDKTPEERKPMSSEETPKPGSDFPVTTPTTYF